MTPEPATQPEADSTLERRPVNNGLLLQGSSNPPAASEIAGRIEPLIADHLEQASCWPDHELREGSKLGDFSFYAIGFRAAGFKGLYVRFISEPHREAMLEICSSSQDPDLKDSAPIPMKEVLLNLGFHPGSDGAGFHKLVRVESLEDCRSLAQEIAGLVTGCLGYDPSGPIVFKREFRSRTQSARVFHSLQMGDIARLLRSSGLVLWQIDGQPDAGYRTVDRPRFDVRPFAETAPGSGYFRAFTFSFYVRLEPEIADQIVKELGTKNAFARMTAKAGVLSIAQSVSIVGGVTEGHLQFHLVLWRRMLNRVVAVYYGLLEDHDE